MGANGDEIRAGRAVIVFPQANLFSFGQVHSACLPVIRRGDSRIARFLYHTTNTSRKTGVLFYPMAEHDRSIYDADIAKNYDRVSPLAQIQKPRETIKNS